MYTKHAYTETTSKPDVKRLNFFAQIKYNALWSRALETAGTQTCFGVSTPTAHSVLEVQ